MESLLNIYANKIEEFSKNIESIDSINIDKYVRAYKAQIDAINELDIDTYNIILERIQYDLNNIVSRKSRLLNIPYLDDPITYLQLLAMSFVIDLKGCTKIDSAKEEKLLKIIAESVFMVDPWGFNQPADDNALSGHKSWWIRIEEWKHENCFNYSLKQVGYKGMKARLIELKESKNELVSTTNQTHDERHERITKYLKEEFPYENKYPSSSTYRNRNWLDEK